MAESGLIDTKQGCQWIRIAGGQLTATSLAHETLGTVDSSACSEYVSDSRGLGLEGDHLEISPHCVHLPCRAHPIQLS
jgi:hypothetical protein